MIREKCPICLEKYRQEKKTSQVFVFPCGHHSHSACSEKWFSIKSKCPLCQKNIVLEEKSLFWTVLEELGTLFKIYYAVAGATLGE